tara:strand:- start:705 stop:1682 length:978 start_codon:yes stop_codon:yes gene_type:complete
MRKLLLGTTALAAAATISANVAIADVSISGYYEWKYQSTSSNITANDGTTFGSDSEIAFKFSNKTDSGLTIGMTTEMLSDGDENGNSIDEGSLSISGGFGKVVMGQNDFVGDNYGVASTDLPAEEIYQTGVDTLSVLGADITDASADANKIAYHLPAMGGLTAGVSIMNSGAVGDADSTAVGAKYAMDAGGAAVTLGFATVTTENATQDIDSQVVGVKVSSGNITAAVSQSTYEANNADEESTGAAVSFKVSDAMTITVHTAETDDSGSNEEYSNTGAEIAYTVAPGLSAYINVEDFDYTIGTGAGAGTTADAGTVSKLTIKATF